MPSLRNVCLKQVWTGTEGTCAYPVALSQLLTWLWVNGATILLFVRKASHIISGNKEIFSGLTVNWVCFVSANRTTPGFLDASKSN